MKISDTQLSEYMALYETSYGVRLERTKALAQLNKLLSLVLYIIFPESTVGTLEKELAEEYTNRGIQKV